MKPTAVLRAEWALWAWTAWICAVGIVQLWSPGAASEQVIAQFRDLAGVDMAALRKTGIAIYAIVGLSMVLVIFQIGDGKRWARFMLLLSFVIEVLWVAGQGVAGPWEVAADVPDFGLQLVALYLLYTAPGRDWFSRARTS